MLRDLAAGGDAPPSAAAAAVVRLCGRERWQPYQVNHLRRVLGAAGPAALAAWDCDDLRAALERARTPRNGKAGRQTVAAALRDAKLAPELDPDGRFASHLRLVPRAFLDAQPALWGLPVEFAVWLRHRRWAGDDDLGLCVEIGARCAATALGRCARRPAERVALASVRQVAVILGEILRAVAPAGLRATLLAVRDPAGAVDVVARAVAHTQRLRGRRTRLPEELANHRPRRSLQYFHVLIRAGVLASQGVPCETVLPMRAVAARMAALEAGSPARYAAHERVDRVRGETRLAPPDVERLYAACRTRRERAVLAVLAEAAFRGGALANARLSDVWDADRAEVRPVIALLEKGARTRRNIPNRRLREALRDYVVGERGAVGPWLFPHLRNPRLRSKRVATTVVDALCARVGLVGVSPHSFRRYVVNTAMRAGNRLETVQKWLGHSHAATTMRHYWTDDLGEWDVATPVLHEAGGGAAAELADALAEVERLRSALRSARGAGDPATRPPPDEEGAETATSSCPAAWWD